MMKMLPPFLRELLALPPRAGEGVHAWLFNVARQLHAHLPAVEIITLLESKVANCGRHVPRAEIVSAVQSALGSAWQPTQSTPNQTGAKWPTLDKEQRALIVHNGNGLADLWELSLVPVENNQRRTEEIADKLFPDNPLLCCGKSNSIFDTKPRESWRGELSDLQFIVPSPMSALMGRKKNPKPGESEWSAHTLDNTGTRRFLICEFDTGTPDDHAALLLHLGTFAPLICVVHSGGKSLHGWFFVAGQPEIKVQKFFRYAVSLGADHMTWTLSQFVRMPDGTRDNGNRQTVFFLNFKPMEKNL
jgi:hypothetical protein